MMNENGKVAFITGGGQGIGLAIATKLAESGIRVILADLNEEKAKEAADQIKINGGKAHAFRLDVTQPSSVESTVREINNLFGKIDILVNNAGMVLRESALETSNDGWQRILDINLLGPINCCREIVPIMAQNKWGRIINICTAQIDVVEPVRGAYITTKAALAALTRVLAVDLAMDGITVNGIAPGWTETAINQKALDGDPETLSYILEKMPMKRMAKPYEIGSLANYLCSEDAGYLTGQIVFIDGGWTIW